VLNDCAQLILEELRGQHRQYVFTSKRGHSRRRLKHVIAASWRSARVRAAQKYREQSRTDSPVPTHPRARSASHIRTALTGCRTEPGRSPGPSRTQASRDHNSLQCRRGGAFDPSGQSRPDPEHGFLHDLAACRRVPRRSSTSQSHWLSMGQLRKLAQ
jgi:hypothetical protein